MPYVQTPWTAHKTVVSSGNMNKIEKGIADAVAMQEMGLT